ncbi:hypothetical protein Tco_0167142, partial [Tanacetum coccineum]
VASDDLRDALSVIFGLSELKVASDDLRDALSVIFGLSELKPYHQATLLTPERKRIREPIEGSADHPADGWTIMIMSHPDDDINMIDVERDEEEEHLAPVDPPTVPTDDLIPSS